MQLLRIIKEKVQTTDKAKLIKKLGYNSVAKGISTLEKLLKSEDIRIWLRESHYDLVNNSTSFLEKLCEFLEVDDVFCKNEIKNAKKYNTDYLKLKETYIFINTDFKRTTEPIHVLAFCESRRRLSLDNIDELIEKTFVEIVEVLSLKIKNHYISVNGKITIWGEIKNYVVHLYGKTYLFDVDGTFLGEDNLIRENRASVHI